MRYTKGLGRRMVENSDTSTLPPVFMHALGVGVGGTAVWEGVAVGVWVLRIG
jgi:hypothetical protein